MSLYTSHNPVFATFSFYAALLIIKTLFVAFLTGWTRFRKHAFQNPEDCNKMNRGKVKIDEDVERVRRAHLNDLENILPFLTIAFVYVGTGPSLGCAKFLFRLFTAARFMHTLVYAVFVIPQPARALAFFGGMMANLYMIYAIVTTYASGF
ncbi:microsomal glutathione S-transferase 1-like isoform X3 [Daphnia pulex]|uniref:microsomal glutathione S-transferase 1-like isoform X3 n=1 Tax=Daphnia pulex TaxID=6669 RepID=UPI001EE0F70E|nr:microsomal glutathione S-transferase 1-like isoform X3 [Daphnia pulex]